MQKRALDRTSALALWARAPYLFRNFSNSKIIIAICLLSFVFLAALFSMAGDSLTMDEVAHLPAGYSYLTQKDMRLNPEHPPLIKDLAAIPLLFMPEIKFPSEIKDWKEEINGQWGFGFHFLYKMDNPADKMIFWSRIPMILMLVLLGAFLFKWARGLYGDKVGLLVLVLFSFSPTFLAHGRLVTTDIGATLGILASTYYFLSFLKSPSKENIIYAGLVLGFALLAKFNAFLLLPFFGILIIAKSIISSNDFKSCIRVFASYFLSFVFILIFCFALIWLVYGYHVWNYPPERQMRDIAVLMSSHPIRFLSPVLQWSAKITLLRPLTQYFFGLFLVYQRAAYGHTTYFLGEVSAAGWKVYFPVVYAIKEPLTFHILTIIALLWWSVKIKKPFWQDFFKRLKAWISSHFTEFAFLVFCVIYWASSITSPLNIGVRHLLPVFPFIILLACKEIGDLLKPPYLKLKYAALGALVLWQVVSVLSVYPHFLSYFNELAGGPDEAYTYVVDSNLDWGQDLKRLKKWLDQNHIKQIYVDYFGGTDAQYYLKEKFMPWWGTRPESEFEKPNLLAVSVSLVQGGKGMPVPGFNQPFGYYIWLEKYKPIAKIGYSIFIYYIE